ncbi:MAG TPA: hypothetical protein VH351_11520 [Bryobacteraceae bacterium]|jgi:hypothetical protein|nr:hypothetical protein [Bryobacteraceae bacterium]
MALVDPYTASGGLEPAAITLVREHIDEANPFANNASGMLGL